MRAAEFSFLLAIPAILGAGLLQIPAASAGSLGGGWGPLALGFLVSLVAGIFAIKLLVVLLRRGTFHRFAPYCLALGLATLVWGLVT